ncbi:hypothetical protein CQW23_18170 [Capsicum baccatum]|uniref:Uncharacterized protein n=1 Tax=Capsicum baccatum TaxID=33114 RepID=A0A2G2WFX6_CAPBA|nr:hypothetical protein CQW23_18170 [Capsicum baccatum]
MRNDSSIINILGEHIEDLSLLKRSHLSYDILRAIGERCPNLRAYKAFIASIDGFSDCYYPEILCINVFYLDPLVEADLLFGYRKPQTALAFAPGMH